MQDCYVGDVGDLGKYALLIALAGSDLRLGVVWYLNPDEERKGDGLFVDYPKLRGCGGILYDQLQAIVRSGARNVAAVERGGVLPQGTRFYSQPLAVRELRSPRERLLVRKQWFQSAAEAVSDADLVFLDPDNGFAPDSVAMSSARGQKYVFREEVTSFMRRNQSLVIYHHARREALEMQVGGYRQMLGQESSHHSWALTFHRMSVRIFFVVAAEQHSRLLKERSEQFARSAWGEHFRLH